MSVAVPSPILNGSKALVCGIANEHSIAYGCAKAFRELGADLAITYANEKSKSYVQPLARTLEAPIFMSVIYLVVWVTIGPLWWVALGLV